jgi:hypothetical protein
LFLATGCTRVTLDHLRKKLRFRPYVSPDPILEDLEGHAAILHPAHVRTFMVVPTEPLDECLVNLVWKTVYLLVNCPQPEAQPDDDSTCRSAYARRKRSRLVTETKLPFTFGTTDYLALVRIKPAQAKGETIGVVGRYNSCLAQRPDSPLHKPSLPVLNPADFPASPGLSSGPKESVPGLDRISRLLC